MKNIIIPEKCNPILKPDPKNVWRSLMVYNPGLLYENGVYHLFYRAVGGGWISKIGYAASKDGKKFICDKYSTDKNSKIIKFIECINNNQIIIID